MRKKGGPEFEYLWDFTPIISTFAQVISQSVSNSGCSDDKMSVAQATSSPKPTINVNKKQKVAKKKASQRLTILNINCQSVKSKVPDLHQVKPDIIFLGFIVCPDVDGFYTYYIHFCPDDFAISVQLGLF
jgi:hypothetical protein